MGHAVGIDLGTSNSCIAVVIDGKPVVIPDSKGRRTTPSVVRYLAADKVLIGYDAKIQVADNPSNTVYSAKRLIGRKSFSGEVKKAKLVVPYEIVDGDNDSVLIELFNTPMSIPQISAQILKKLKGQAEAYLKTEVTDAVITVPAYFNDGQRQATKDAGEIAGLNVMRIINEPTAAALAYGYGKDIDKRVVVYDLGGGTFDVSILEIGDEVFEVLSSAGDSFLGGDDFDDRLVDHLAEQFQSQFKINPRSDKKALQRLKLLAEDTKIKLSEQEIIEIMAPILEKEGKRLAVKSTLSRKLFNQLTFDLMQRTFKVCDEALQQAHMTVSNIDGVILVGGSTKMPVVREMAEQYFFRKPDANINPDEVVAVGAAIQAASLEGAVGGSLLLDVTSHSLGIQTVGNRMEVLITQNASIPIEQTKVFTTGRDNQEVVRVKVFQGEEDKASDNELLGEFVLEGIENAARGVPRVEVRFEIDADGMVNVSAEDTRSGKAKNVKLEVSGGMARAAVEQAKINLKRMEMEA